jgi:2-polyprenyl-3-methyl-5-hydroxy-6-metoxy-1,4-benzoquinol methylase
VAAAELTGVAAPLCPLCGRSLQPGGWGGAPQALDGWPLAHCPSCQHTCCPAAYAENTDYDELYAEEYAAQQVAPLRNRARHIELALLPPYRAFFRELGAARRRSVLDVGCGAGRFLLAARLQGWEVRGIEPAQRAVAAAQAGGLWLPVTAQTPEQVAATGAMFAVVTLFDVLEHTADPTALLRSTLPLLAPGGSLFITVPNWASPLMQQAVRRDWLPPVHLQFFSAASLAACALAAAPDRLAIAGSGRILSDPAPPPGLAALWLRWASRRLRGLPVHQPQLWLHARLS